MLRKKGQSTLEYVVVLTAIIAAVLVGVGYLANKSNSAGVGKLMDNAGKNIKCATERLPVLIK